MLRTAAIVLALCLLTMGVEGTCTVKNQSSQPIVIVPKVGVVVEVAVGVSVVLHDSQQNCYIQNKKSGHKKGPVVLANEAIYVVVDAILEVGKVNFCKGTLVGAIIEIGAIILGGI